MISPAEHLIDRMAMVPECTAEVTSVLASLSATDAAALAYDWEEFWARENQIPPDGPWRSWGFLTARGVGKTRSCAEHVNAEASSGRAARVALVAQNEDKVYDVMIAGEAGLIACSPPWCKARFELGRVVWPNGAQAFVYTPERPGSLFGPEHHLGWASEIHAWPRSSMHETFSNLKMGLRLGYSRLLWDSNPRRRHPLIKMLLERAMRHPVRHVVVRGATWENRLNLGAGVIEEWEDEFGGTQLGRQMLLGEQLDDDDGAPIKQAWIDAHRRELPTKVKRAVLAIDPAISSREGTDATGMVRASLALDDQIMVCGDYSKHFPTWEEWGRLAAHVYFRDKCDCCIVERNRGGDACVANLRAACQQLGFTLIVLRHDARCPGHTPGVMHVKEITSRGSKDVREEPVAALYERGRISHVRGIDLSELEEEETTWVPDPKLESPNRLDALVFCVWEVANLWSERRDVKADVRAAAKAAARIKAPHSPNVSALLARFGQGRRL